ncbi:MAG: hypothetical protein ACRDUV_01815 [Pseudonocardiaceae bacterium]
MVSERYLGTAQDIAAAVAAVLYAGRPGVGRTRGTAAQADHDTGRRDRLSGLLSGVVGIHLVGLSETVARLPVVLGLIRANPA